MKLNKIAINILPTMQIKYIIFRFMQRAIYLFKRKSNQLNLLFYICQDCEGTRNGTTKWILYYVVHFIKKIWMADKNYLALHLSSPSAMKKHFLIIRRRSWSALHNKICFFLQALFSIIHFGFFVFHYSYHLNDEPDSHYLISG